MNHLPPPPPNVAPYSPPPPPGGQQYPYPYQGQQAYPPPPPPAAYGNPPYQPNGYGQDHSSPPRSGPPGPPKSKMQVTRYPPPPGRRPYPGQQAPSNHPAPPSQGPYAGYNPASPAYPPNQAPPAYPPYPQHPPPPPNQAPYAGYNQAPPARPPLPPPPPNQAPYAGHNQSPPLYPPYPPPPQPNAYHHANQSTAPYSAPQAPLAHYQPQPAWSPPPSATSRRGPPPTRASAHPVVPSASSAAPYHRGPEVIKGRDDPTFYDGWDDDEFDMEDVLWPKSSDAIDERFSIGQYIWHPAERLTRAISVNIDVPLWPAPVAQRHDRNIIVSKYFQGKEDENEGSEYIYTFQRIRNVENEWAERKDDPIFRTFSPQDSDRFLDVEQVKQQVLEDARRLRESDSKDETDVMGSLEEALSSYIGTAAPPAAGSTTEPPDGTAVKAGSTEALLASLGVSGEAKPVYNTPFPAYASSNEQIPTSNRRTSSTQSPHQAPPPQHAKPPPQRGYHGPPLNHSLPPPPSAYRPPPHLQPPYPNQPPPIIQYPNRLPPHMGHQNYPPPPSTSSYQTSAPSYNRKRSASVDSFADPWKVGNGRDSTPLANGPGTPVGSDFGDFPVNGSASENTLKAESRSPPLRQSSDHGDYKKRKIDENDGLQRKRSKPKANVDSAYQ
ncbi:hypothetical protein E6O75_ATG03498 [Venturia nashicola]|uniref:Uncharacterized protein n=1 Tax=Venturia nashicola TaxID=86259 RepID=A0A4Z1PAE4_9PEZI|nr:hypothetical protein E6O75_ATG03498 [Venturia nashicola]